MTDEIVEGWISNFRSDPDAIALGFDQARQREHLAEKIGDLERPRPPDHPRLSRRRGRTNRPDGPARQRVNTRLAEPRGRFRAVAREKLADEHTQQALDEATARLLGLRTQAWAELEDVEGLRERARAIRTSTMADLERHLAAFTTALEARGGQVHRCATAADATAAVVGICRAAGAKLAAKSKTMASEEIGLNAALEAAGVDVVETDLGEYILQLAGEHPVHIVAPAIEKTAEQVADLFGTGRGPARLERPGRAHEDRAQAAAQSFPRSGRRDHGSQLSPSRRPAPSASSRTRATDGL